MTTSEQVAQLAGVSRATVSRVLNGSTRISPEARERVHNAMKTLGYEPNVMAQNLARQSSHLIALGLYAEEQGLSISHLGSTENSFYVDMLKSIDREVLAAGYDLFLPSLSHRKPQSYVRMLQAWRVAGAIMLAIDQVDPRIQALLSAGIPSIFIDTMGQGPHATYVKSNYTDGVREATEYLLALGHTRIAFINGPQADPVSTERLLGCQQALARAGIAFNPKLLRYAGWNIDEAHLAAREFLSEQRDFTAIIAASDMTAIGVLRALHEYGLRIPDDVSLIGFDDLVLCQYTIPTLTTVRQDRAAMGSGAIQRLVALIEGREHVAPFIVPTQLVIRESTGPAPCTE